MKIQGIWVAGHREIKLELEGNFLSAGQHSQSQKVQCRPLRGGVISRITQWWMLHAPLSTCQAKWAYWSNRSMTIMKAATTFWLASMCVSQLGIPALYSKSRRKHTVEDIICFKGEPSYVTLLNVYVVKLSSKCLCLCLQISADLSLGLRNFSSPFFWFLSPVSSD